MQKLVCVLLWLPWKLNLRAMQSARLAFLLRLLRISGRARLMRFRLRLGASRRVWARMIEAVFPGVILDTLGQFGPPAPWTGIYPG